MSRSQELVPLLAFVLLLGVTWARSECSACHYRAWNCTPTVQHEERVAKGVADPPNGIRTSSSNVPAEQPIAVCDRQGRIQVDDIFCDQADCSCAPGKHCVDMVVGCSNIFQARSRRRCVGNATLTQRFHKCATLPQLSGLKKPNLEPDWIFFKDRKRCKSLDCVRVREFQHCDIAQCGYLVTSWKEDSAFHFVFDGSKSEDMVAGTFHVSVPVVKESLVCTQATTTRINDCYALQTRNVKNGSTCDGVYIQYDTSLKQVSFEDYELSSLSWPAWLAVVGSVCAALLSVGAVGVAYYRHRTSAVSEDLDVEELLQPHESSTTTHNPVSERQETKEEFVHQLCQRAASPRVSGKKMDHEDV